MTMAPAFSIATASFCLFLVWNILDGTIFFARAFTSSLRSARTTLAATTTLRMVAASSTTASSPTSTCNTNPLLESWASQPFHLPPFAKIEPSHFPPALEEGMKTHLADLQAIVDDSAEPTFENVLVAYDRAGSQLSKVQSVYGNLCSSLNSDELQAVQREMSPILSRHSSACYTLPGLFQKIEKVHDKRQELGLTEEQQRLVERVHLDFTRAGAHFDEATQKEYTEIKAELATLTTEFMQNVLKDEEEYELVLTKKDLVGCPDTLIEAARQAAVDRGHKEEDAYVVTLGRSLVEPFLTFADRRDLRKTAWEAWTKRGEMFPDRDNLKIATKILKLRKRQAEVHGYKTFADYQCIDRMAKTPENVMSLLENVWARAKESAKAEREALEEYVQSTGEALEGGIQPWDWRYFAEKVRIARYDFDESLLKPYFSLDKVVGASQAVSGKLFGLQYVPREDIELYHPDVKTYEVREGDDLRAIFIHDNYARPFKSSGAWMSELRSQSRNLPTDADAIEGIPVVLNNNNFAKGATTFLSFDDAHTLFHEFGHGHHGMLSDATYDRLASTNVLTDFVELPSQLMEHWIDQPEVLKEHCKHHETGEPVPDDLLAKLKAAKNFNQGFATIEYTACALLDMALHMQSDYDDDFDLTKFEDTELGRLGMPQGIVMRHRPAHFAHLFASTYYAAGYYVYLWAEVLDADAFAAFEETGNVFDPEVAKKCREFIYSAGNTQAPDELFRKFRGRDPEIEFMLKKKGLLSEK